MERVVLKSKLHRARVTETDKDYDGSITVDRELLSVARIVPYEQVQVVNITNGERFVTYAIEGEVGECCVNGAAARLTAVGDRIIVMSYGIETAENPQDPEIVRLNENNQIID